MRIDWRALGYAVVLEMVLAGLAVLGGPHGALGAWPWMLQLPGILLVFFVKGEAYFAGRVAAMLAIQLALWYAVFAFIRRRRMSRARSA